MNPPPILQIRDAKLPDDIASIRKLWTDYLTWGNDNMQLFYGVHPHNPTEQIEIPEAFWHYLLFMGLSLSKIKFRRKSPSRTMRTTLAVEDHFL